MSQFIEIHSNKPQQKLLNELCDALKEGSVIAYPTDSGFALGCKMGLKKPLQRIKQIRNLDDKHNFTLICRDLSEISLYAKVDNPVYRILKRLTPGSYTFILPATSKVPTLMLNKSKKTVGIRIPDHPIPLALSETLGEPILSTTLILPNQNEPLIYAEDVSEHLNYDLNYILDCGYCGYEPTTVIDFSTQPYEILRHGSGDVSLLE
ncbi:threonylcarbamoyl-AMP synthase [Thiotrichales bacterium 19S11-10]|nr:threonylcarbamoyl-AMP synthase [Thiotrichales bacterium 19S11-10]MCF6808419.1 threonylcarbamoyl-AMP synthase [Thiotrichales bacterium 19S9-11]MCF6812389.1 threonylcarbamoyl-AMP synthase [Thiotrichales bacterium 19S9-12]